MLDFTGFRAIHFVSGAGEWRFQGGWSIMGFDDEMVILSGHGPATTIGEERVNNPFLQHNSGNQKNLA